MDFDGGEFRLRKFEKFSQAVEWSVLGTLRFGVFYMPMSVRKVCTRARLALGEC